MLHVITGPMFSGKTTTLLHYAEMSTIAGRDILHVKHSADDRYSKEDIVTHDGCRTHAEMQTRDALDVLALRWHDVVCIDEGQFFDEQIVDLAKQTVGSLDLYVAGLDMDIHADPFPHMASLMAMADTITKRTAVCTRELRGVICGRQANHTARMGSLDKGNEPHIEVGGLETYLPRCRRCYVEHVATPTEMSST